MEIRIRCWKQKYGRRGPRKTENSEEDRYEKGVLATKIGRENWRERTKMRDIGDPRKIWRPKQGLERGMGS